MDIKKLIEPLISKLKTENILKVYSSDSTFNVILTHNLHLDIFKEYFNDTNNFSIEHLRRMFLLLVLSSMRQKEGPDRKAKSIRIILTKLARLCSDEAILYISQIIQNETNENLRLIIQELRDQAPNDLVFLIIELTNKVIQVTHLNFNEEVVKAFKDIAQVNQYHNILDEHFDLFNKLYLTDLTLFSESEHQIFSWMAEIPNLLDDGIWLVFSAIYNLKYDEKNDLFIKADEQILKNLVYNARYYIKTLVIVQNLSGPFRRMKFLRKFYKQYYNISIGFKQNTNIELLESLWKAFSIQEIIEIKDNQFFIDLLKKLEIITKSPQNESFKIIWNEFMKGLIENHQNKNIKTSLNEKNEGIQETQVRPEILVNIIIETLKKLQINQASIKPGEDEISNAFCMVFNPFGKNLNIQCQRNSSEGYSETMKSYGNPDLKFIRNADEIECYGEAIIVDGLKGANNTWLQSRHKASDLMAHYKKLLKNYDLIGNKYNILITYAKIQEFGPFWITYLDFFKSETFEPSVLNNKIDDISKKYNCDAFIRVGVSQYQKGSETCSVFHIVAKFENT